MWTKGRTPHSGKAKRKGDLNKALLDELRAAGDEGMSIDAILLEFSDYHYTSVHGALSRLCQAYPIKKRPLRRNADGNIMFQYILKEKPLDTSTWSWQDGVNGGGDEKEERARVDAVSPEHRY